MPRRSLKSLQAREEKAQQQMLALLYMTPVNLSGEDLRKVEEEIERIESMTDEDLRNYYRSPIGLAEIEYDKKIEREIAEWEATSLEQRPTSLGRKLIRCGKLEFYREIHARLIRGMSRKKIAAELGVSIHRLKIALRALRRLTGEDYKHHRHGNPVEFNRCPQCRGYANSGNRKPYDEKLDGTAEPRRKHKRNEISQSRRNMQRGETDEE